MRSSFLYGVLLKNTGGRREIHRPMLVEELFAAQGIPTLLPHSHCLTKCLPELLTYGKTRSADKGKSRASVNQLRMMAGNGQHTSSI
eukprot:10261251-Alexandrium_andersonii.AAC.1